MIPSYYCDDDLVFIFLGYNYGLKKVDYIVNLV